LIANKKSYWRVQKTNEYEQWMKHELMIYCEPMLTFNLGLAYIHITLLNSSVHNHMANVLNYYFSRLSLYILKKSCNHAMA